MVAGEFDSRISTAVVSSWPEPLDIEVDIFIPGKVEKWTRELVSALRTRKLYDTLRQLPPTLQQIAEENPDDDASIVVAAFDDIMEERQQALDTRRRCELKVGLFCM